MSQVKEKMRQSHEDSAIHLSPSQVSAPGPGTPPSAPKILPIDFGTNYAIGQERQFDPSLLWTPLTFDTNIENILGENQVVTKESGIYSHSSDSNLPMHSDISIIEKSKHLTDQCGLQISCDNRCNYDSRLLQKFPILNFSVNRY